MRCGKLGELWVSPQLLLRAVLFGAFHDYKETIELIYCEENWSAAGWEGRCREIMVSLGDKIVVKDAKIERVDAEII